MSAVVRPLPGLRSKCSLNVGTAQVELDQHHAASGQRDRVGEVHRHRRLALTGDRAGHKQRVELARDGGEVERAAQDAIGLE